VVVNEGLKERVKQLLTEHHWMVESTSFILAVVAILFAVIQFVHSKSILRDMQEHLERMREISSSMSTAHVGEFPENLQEIIRITDAKRDVRRLCIMADLLGYGNYSAPELFDDYRGNLERISGRGGTIRIIVYPPEEARRMLKDEFPQGDFAREKLKDCYKLYFGRYHTDFGPTPPGEYNEFLDDLNKAEVQYVSALRGRGNIEIRHVRGKLPFYLWLQDDREAVFSFLQTAGTRTNELSFRTRDGKLISTFQNIFKELWDEETLESQVHPPSLE
jgi:hypothetical protein